ncbi:uncharacterized [Tachysurus ichikawai]
MKLGCVSRAELSSLTPIHTQTLTLAFIQQPPAREQVPQGQREELNEADSRQETAHHHAALASAYKSQAHPKFHLLFKSFLRGISIAE